MTSNDHAFDVIVFDKPLDVIRPRLGGYLWYASQDRGDPSIKDKFTELAHNKGRVERPQTFNERVQESGFDDAWEAERLYQLLQISDADDFCILETADNPSDSFAFRDYIGEFCGAGFLSFRCDFYKGKPSGGFMKVRNGSKTLRAVHAWAQEGDDPNRVKWTFKETGVPQSWEDVSNYQERRVKDRISRDVLIGCMKRFGMEFDRFEGRSFDKIVQFTTSGGGTDLECYRQEGLEVQKAIWDETDALLAGRWPY